MDVSCRSSVDPPFLLSLEGEFHVCVGRRELWWVPRVPGLQLGVLELLRSGVMVYSGARAPGASGRPEPITRPRSAVWAWLGLQGPGWHWLLDRLLSLAPGMPVSIDGTDRAQEARGGGS